MSWLPVDANGSGTALTLCRVAATRAEELEAALYAEDRIDPAVVRLVRDRVNHLLGLPGAAFDARAPLGERERAALAFAEQYVLDPAGVTDEQAAAINLLFTEPELTALTFAVAVYDAMARVHLVLDLAPEQVSP
jgi:alkylhydroperoxidase family enzyme